MARQNFTCCQNCGHAEIHDEIEAASKLAEVRGYTFYHMQDTERAAQGGGVYLAYDALSGGPDAQNSIGHEIVAALRAAGLEPEWNGENSARILIPLEWKRRRFSSPAGAPAHPSRIVTSDARNESLPRKPWWKLW